MPSLQIFISLPVLLFTSHGNVFTCQSLVPLSGQARTRECSFLIESWEWWQENKRIWVVTWQNHNLLHSAWLLLAFLMFDKTGQRQYTRRNSAQPTVHSTEAHHRCFIYRDWVQGCPWQSNKRLIYKHNFSVWSTKCCISNDSAQRVIEVLIHKVLIDECFSVYS